MKQNDERMSDIFVNVSASKSINAHDYIHVHMYISYMS